jgi:putative phage-type endonuclease
MTAQRLNSFGIGASEIAAIAGLNPYSSPWDVWRSKVDGVETPSNAPMEWGHRLEPAIRQKYADDTNVKVMVPETSLYHPVIPWARATPDGIVLDEKSGDAAGAVWKHLLQCKNVGTWVERAWRSAPPEYVQLQEQWELNVTNLQRADIAVLIGGNDFRIYTVHRDDTLINDLVDIAARFWERVEKRVAPEVDESDACRDHFVKKLAKADAVELVADERSEALFAEWRILHLQQRQAETRLKIIRNLLLSDLVDAQADRIASTIGTAKLVRKPSKEATETNWRFIAEMLGERLEYKRDEWSQLVGANTTTLTTAPSVALYPPKEWSKDS